MKRIITIALNDIKIEFTSAGVWLTFLVLPIVFTAILGIATGGLSEIGNADQRILVAVVDQDVSELSGNLIHSLSTSDIVRVIDYEYDPAFTAMEEAEVSGILIINSGFGKTLLDGEKTEITLHLPTAGNQSLVVRQTIEQASAQISQVLLAVRISVEEAEIRRQFANKVEKKEYFEAGMELAKGSSPKSPIQVKTEQAEEAPEPVIANGFSQSSPGQLVTWVLSTMLAGSVAIVYERKIGTLRRLITTPATKGSILAGKITGRFTLGMIQMIIMVIFGQFVLGVNWGNSLLAMAMVAVCFGLAATALGLLFSTISRNENQAGGYASLGTFLLAPLGGAWVPLEITPISFQKLANIFPTTWAMRGFTDVIVRGQAPSGVLFESLILLGFATLFFTVGVWRFRYE